MENKLIRSQEKNVLCDGKTDLFFSDKTQDMREAQMICSGCNFRTSCLDIAQQTRPFAGVWGGVVFINGEMSLNKRGRGRPRKSEQLENARIAKALANSAANSLVAISSDQEVSQRIA